MRAIVICALFVAVVVNNAASLPLSVFSKIAESLEENNEKLTDEELLKNLVAFEDDSMSDESSAKDLELLEKRDKRLVTINDSKEQTSNEAKSSEHDDKTLVKRSSALARKLSISWNIVVDTSDEVEGLPDDNELRRKRHVVGNNTSENSSSEEHKVAVHDPNHEGHGTAQDKPTTRRKRDHVDGHESHDATHEGHGNSHEKEFVRRKRDHIEGHDGHTCHDNHDHDHKDHTHDHNDHTHDHKHEDCKRRKRQNENTSEDNSSEEETKAAKLAVKAKRDTSCGCSHSDHEPHDHKAHDQEAHDHEAHDHKAHDHEVHDHKAHDHKAHDHETHDHEAHDHEAHEHGPNLIEHGDTHKAGDGNRRRRAAKDTNTSDDTSEENSSEEKQKQKQAAPKTAAATIADKSKPQEEPAGENAVVESTNTEAVATLDKTEIRRKRMTTDLHNSIDKTMVEISSVMDSKSNASFEKRRIPADALEKLQTFKNKLQDWKSKDVKTGEMKELNSSVEDYVQGCEVMDVNSYEANETIYFTDHRKREQSASYNGEGGTAK